MLQNFPIFLAYTRIQIAKVFYVNLETKRWSIFEAEQFSQWRYHVGIILLPLFDARKLVCGRLLADFSKHLTIESYC